MMISRHGNTFQIISPFSGESPVDSHKKPTMRCFEVPFLVNLNTLRPRQNGRHFADDIFKCIFLNENVWIPIKISLKFVPKGSINNIPALVQIMAWCRPGDKPLSDPTMVSLTTHICVIRPQWVNRWIALGFRRHDTHFTSPLWYMLSHCPYAINNN